MHADNETYFRAVDPSARHRQPLRNAAPLPSDAELAAILQEMGAPPDLPLDELRQMYAMMQQGVPGGMPEEDDEDEEDEEVEEEGGALGGLWRALLGRGRAQG